MSSFSHQEWSSPAALQLQLFVGVFLTFVAGCALVWLLSKIHRHSSTVVQHEEAVENVEAAPNKASPVVMEDINDLQLSSNNSSDNPYGKMDDPQANGSISKPKPSSSRRSARVGHWSWWLRWFTSMTNLWIVATVGTLILLNYLLLVFLPSGLGLSSFAMVAVTGILLKSSIAKELRQHYRLDRLMGIVTLFLCMAATLSLATYARFALQEGSIYEGPARIVGYDETDSYKETNQTSTEYQETMRTDLQVAWGGDWGCPDNPTECVALVSGALCETSYNDRFLFRSRRRLEEEFEEEETEALEEENEELEEENEELEEDLDAEEAYDEELYGALIGEETVVYYDKMYDDDWWTMVDWDNVWGDYACTDLFETDLSGQAYNADTPPGSDEWPYVTIYGSCNSCEAYLVDYYSTEHFAGIQDYQRQARNYAIAALVALLLTGLAIVKRRLSSSPEKEIELLTDVGGVVS